MEKHRQKILITDDSEMNRAILTDILDDDYEIIEAANGVEAVAALQKYSVDLSLVLLDIVMPQMDGFEVLNIMNSQGWIEDIPVIMISAETDPSAIERAYELGVTDFISRPFDAMIVRRRVVNTTLVNAKQKKLIDLVADQIYEKEQRSSLMIDILSHIVGFKNGESAQHVLQVRLITEILLKNLVQKTDAYPLTWTDISTISLAAALHDIGKIAIPDEILNKPGRLTDAEFEIIKGHSVAGAQILEDLPMHQDAALVLVAAEICRWHHERYDGRGYPDGLKGEEIPIAAQIVSLADVYDALTSVRVYKGAYSHDEAIQMITRGECGAFNPLLLECLNDCSATLKTQFSHHASSSQSDQREIRSVAGEMLRHKELSASERTLHLLEQERMKNSFFAELSDEIQFEFTLSPPIVTLTPQGAKKLGLPETILDPMGDPQVQQMLDVKNRQGLSDAVRSTSAEQPVTHYDCQLTLHGESRWYRLSAMALWSSDEPPRYTGAIGKAVDIHDSRTRMEGLEWLASHDPLTGLLNHASARERIKTRLEGRPMGRRALVIFDLDRFKQANDNRGHQFGDRVLVHTAKLLRKSVRGGDIIARIGGDEFLIFLEYKVPLRPIIDRIFHSLCGVFEDFPISLSMGIAETDVVGTDYNTLFRSADKALYSIKQGGRGQYCFYDDSLREMLSTISPIENDGIQTTEKESES